MERHGHRKEPFSIASATRFYIPLLLQAISMSLTYPLVAGIITQGRHGVSELTAFSQGQLIMFTIGALGGGLVTTGMVFARTWYGYVSFKRLNALMMAFLLALQCLPAAPPFNRWTFEGLFALPPDLADVARWTLLASVFMNGCFFLRNIPLVILLNNYRSGKATLATFMRILLTLACAWAFPECGMTGAGWGLLALSLGVIVELSASWVFARPYVRELKAGANIPENPSVPAPSIVGLAWEQFRFTLPLSLGNFLLMLSPLIIAAYVGRSANAEDMLAIHYVTIGVANPVNFAALRFQPMAIQFPPEYDGDKRLLVYALCAGAVLGLLPLAFSTQLVGNWYFGIYQHVPERILRPAMLAVGIYSLLPVIQAVRGRIEGLAAAAKRPRTVMAGQITYTIALFCTCAVLLPLGCPGWTMALAAIFTASASATAAIYVTLRRR